MTAGRLVITAGVIALGAPSVAAPQQPTPAQVQQALQQPGTADALRSRIQASGLSPDQIRARLAASGYPTGLLDAYLGSGSGTGQAQATPGLLELQAIQALGLPPLE